MAATIDKEHANKIFDMLDYAAKQRMEGLKDELSVALEERNKAEEKIGEQEDMIEELEEKIDELEDSIVAHKSENDSLKEQIEKIKKENGGELKYYSPMEGRQMAVVELVERLKNEHQKLKEYSTRINKLEKENEMLLWAVEKKEKDMALLKHGDTANLKYELQKQKEEYEARIKQLELRVAGEEASRFRLGKTWDREEAELKSQLLNRNNEVAWLKGELAKKEQYLVAPWGRDDVNSILDGWGLPDLTDEQWLKLYNGAPDQLGFSDSHTDDYLEAIKDCLKEILDIQRVE